MNICHQDRDDLNFPPHHHDPLGVDGAAPGLLAAELRHLALVPHLGSGWLLYVIVPINLIKQPPHPKSVPARIRYCIQYLSKSTKITKITSTSIIPINLIKQPPDPERFLPPTRSTLCLPPRHSFQSLFSGGQSPARASGHFNQSCCLIQNKY